MTQGRTIERGAALTEFAVLMPLFIAIIYGTLYIADLGVLRLRPQEIARYGAWAMASRPLSGFDDDRLNAAAHQRKFSEARDDVVQETVEVYADLDGAHNGLSLFGPAPRLDLPLTTSRGLLEPPGSGSLINRPVSVVPAWANAQWSEPLSRAGVVLSVLGVGTSVETLTSGMFGRLRFNTKGQITARAGVLVAMPVERENEVKALAKAGQERGADLSRWTPRGQPIRELGADRIQTTLIADPWRVTRGYSAIPDGDHSTNRPFGNAVAAASEHALGGLPGGTVLEFLSGLLNNRRGFCRLLSEAGFPGCDAPVAHTLARAYIEDRSTQPNYGPPALAGQVNIFQITGSPSERIEQGAVESFDTLPLYTNPNSPPGDSGMLDSLRKRGHGFMGCPTQEKRGCWE